MASANAIEDAEQAREHRERGLALFDAGAYDAAQVEFSRAYRLDPRAELLFAWAQAARLEGDCITAAGLYRRFIVSKPPTHQAEAASNHLRACEALKREDSASTPAGRALAERQCAAAQTDSSITSSDGGSHRTDRAPRVPWLRDRLALPLVSGSVLSFGTAAALLATARYHVGIAQHAGTYGEFNEHQTSMRRLRIAAGIGAGVGVTLGTAAIIRYVQLRRKTDRTIAVLPVVEIGTDQALVGAQGRF